MVPVLVTVPAINGGSGLLTSVAQNPEHPILLGTPLVSRLWRPAIRIRGIRNDL